MTEWYPPNIKPVRRGVYQILGGDLICFSHWNGKAWSLASHSSIKAKEKRKILSGNQGKTWRGFTKEQK